MPKRLAAADFAVETFQMDRKSEILYSLSRGETIYLASKVPAAAPV